MTGQRLDQLLQGIADAPGAGDIVVSGLTLDSRQVRAGNAFFALQGTRGHGIDFAAGAVEKGAQVVLAEAPARQAPTLGVPVVWIDNLHAQVGEIASRFYGRPSEAMHVVGVTGTNGKTSTVQLIAQGLHHLGHRVATIGTLGAGMHGHVEEGERTTPDAIHVHALMASFREQGATHVAMEVSSHALEQGRVGAVAFDTAVFTNLTRDHLDYHGSMEAYGDAKAKLFAWPTLTHAAINVDDAFGRELLGRVPSRVRTLRMSAVADLASDVRASHIETSAEGLRFDLHTPWGSRPVQTHLIGRFNVDNMLAVIASLGALGEPFERILDAVHALHPVDGRMSRLGGHHGQPLVVVDYAHTPDALEQTLKAVRAHGEGRLICVFGCGGERDAGKRPLMGAIAERLADVAIITDDNPRGEDGDVIVANIVAGLSRPDDMLIERDRAKAIALALNMARTGDVVLIAGKGHETYQEGAQGKRPFDDLAVARAALEVRA
ncbi:MULTISPECIES: UDP-N-acetylmuramoyl-L-alanyl-D-glutamate--2,6-diaminopimelate ligase [Dyella]|uniref:UDP-N-acetylmuramoyl-L-alanyl-D-glutamate--2,6-diaminopimelate ligase n=2 Tax=Dyella TaxID=231454 RepID=A0A4V2NL91_9GAMM|nr:MULTISPECIES: UDP-N-acetylmuramoyl-L-alanyl-D-glutamate--2,6-diaminopimelate ligase [Dyella]TBR36976.1 UDP-N-acetylmuramoyl-L-alanyl-D-glutamate--2,6-diaminopimelate ligase [Dyella terrae]TCI07934.1 UDP-N-acetylmuramoyl-L-alanyl-D-glutamate--2,6-diaminopimelate ligase [Dyella soli]